jgi:hypothetical protein
MADEPDNLVLVMLREMRGDLREVSETVGKLKEQFETRVGHIEKQLDDMTKIVRYTLGQSSETQLRQAQQESRIDELFEKLEKLLSEKLPT